MTDADRAATEGAADALTDAHRERLAAFVERHGFLSWLGLRVDRVERGRIAMSIPGDEKLRNPDSGTVHGGVAASLIDTASGFALRTTFAEPTEASLTTTDLSVSYLRPATADLAVEAEVRRAGRSMGVADMTVTAGLDADRTEVAAGRATYRLFRGEEP